jgi:hypothetical protein
MTIIDLTKQCEIRLEYLKSMRYSCIQLNNIEMVNRIDLEIIQIEQTIDNLKSR